MPPKEALGLAAQQGDVKWIRQLLLRGCKATAAAVAAAGNGHLEATSVLYYDAVFDEFGFCDHKTSIAWEILDAAAAHGHINLLQFAMERAKEAVPQTIFSMTFLPARERSSALASAISSGHDDVVKLLLKYPNKMHWDIGQAFGQAVAEGQQRIAAWIDEIFPGYAAVVFKGSDKEGETLLIHAARAGYAVAVKYLHDKEPCDPETIGKAFVVAARAGSPETLKALEEIAEISSPTFDEAFTCATAVGRVDVVEYLYGHQRVSPESLSTAFKGASTFAVVKFLHGTKRVSVDSVVQVYEEAACNGCLGGAKDFNDECLSVV